MSTKVRTVNPKKKPKKGGGKKRKPVAGKKRKKPRKRRKNPAKKRRRNPGAGLRSKGLVINPRGAFSGAIGRLVGKLASTYAVRKWGDLQGSVSWNMGARWSLKNYFIAILGGGLAGELIGRTISVDFGREMFKGTIDLCVSKAVWHEAIAAIPGGSAVLGNIPAGIKAKMRPGDVADDGRGNRYQMQANGQIVAMMGTDSGSSSGDMGELVEATPLGSSEMGELVEATPLGDYDDAGEEWRSGGRSAAWA